MSQTLPPAPVSGAGFFRSGAWRAIHGFAIASRSMPPDPVHDPRDVSLTDAERAQLDVFLRAVLAESRRVNLTAFGADDAVAARETLLVSSLAMAVAWQSAPPPGVVVDIGSGNGFPGVVAAVLWPEARVLLVERRRKKALAIERCVRAASLATVQVLAEDVRDTAAHRSELRACADLVTARGVGPLAAVNRLAAPLLAPGGRVMHWKATDLDVAELAEGDRVAAACGWRPHRAWRFEPAPPGPGRLIVYARPAQVPA